MKALATLLAIVALPFCSAGAAETPYRALLVHCFAPGQCVVMSVGEFATIPECQARLEVVREFTIMGQNNVRVGIRDDRAFCALPEIGDDKLETLDFIQRHADELRPLIEPIWRREHPAPSRQ